MPVMAQWKSPIPTDLTWEHVVGQVLGRHRRRTPEDRFARRPSRKALIIVGTLLVGFAVLLYAGGTPDVNHDVLIVKKLPKVSPN